MKFQRALAPFLFAGSLLFLCSCYTVGTKFSLPNTDELKLGELQPSDCITLFGQPTSTGAKTTAGVSYVFYIYDDSFVCALSVSERALCLEFKEGKLNGYFLWSSFNKDKTKVDMKNVDPLKAGVGKLTEREVLNMLGKRNAKAFCPTMIEELKGDCSTNMEVWGWYMRGKSGADPARFDVSQIYVWFDASGKVSSVEAFERKE